MYIHGIYIDTQYHMHINDTIVFHQFSQFRKIILKADNILLSFTNNIEIISEAS